MSGFKDCMKKTALTFMTALVVLALGGPVLACDVDKPPANTVITSITGIDGPIDVVRRPRPRNRLRWDHELWPELDDIYPGFGIGH